MWVRRAKYDVLVRAEERAEMLRIRCNQLEQETAELRFAVTGRPQRALHIEKPVGSLALGTGAKNKKQPGEQVLDAIEQGLEIFNDLGDEGARAEGIRTDPEGRVIL
jgi:hypothetical protein